MNNKKSILITRPKIDAEITASEFAAKNYNCIIEPLIKIKFIDLIEEDWINLSKENIILLFTSANAIRAIEQYDINKKNQIICVGDKTAKIAKDFGYDNIKIAQGNVSSLKKYIKDNFSYKDKKFIYLSANIISKDLIVKNYDIKRIIVYNSEPIAGLSKNIISKIKNRQIDICSFYSVHTANIFIDLIKKHNLYSYIKGLTAYCISENVANIFAKNYFKHIKYL